MLFAGVRVQDTGKQTHLCAQPRDGGVRVPSQVDERLLGCPEPWGHGDPALAEGHGDLGMAGLHTPLIRAINYSPSSAVN